MRGIRLSTMGVVVLVVTLGLVVGVALADQHSGTWKANVAKSTYGTGQAPRMMTLKIESDATSFKVSGDGTDAAGKAMHTEFSAKFDGKDYPVTGNPYGDTVSVKRVDADTTESTFKKGGKVTVTVTSVVSKDGKTRTSTYKGKDAEGHDVNAVVVYDKQ